MAYEHDLNALLAFCELFPDADLFTLVQVPGTTSPAIERRRVIRSPLQWLPGVARLYRQYLPLFPFAIEQFDLDDYDLVVSSSHCAAKSVVVPGRARHLCYCHTPMRYAWDQFPAYFGPDQVGPRMHRMLRHLMARLARWKSLVAGRPQIDRADVLAAIHDLARGKGAPILFGNPS